MPTTRVKDAGFLTQNIEKLILAAGLLVLIGAAALFFVGNPFALELNGRTYASADEAVSELKKSDDQLERGLTNPTPLPANLKAPAFLNDYQAMIEEPVIPQGPVKRLARTGLTSTALNPPPLEPPSYAMVYPPPPKDTEYTFGTDVLDTEFNPQVTEEFYKLWGEQREPADFSMIIVAGEFDIWEWVQRLKNGPEGVDKANKIPLGIWSKRFGIAGVALLREEKNEQTGEWGNRQIVPALPGQARVLPTDPMPAKPADALAQVELMRQGQSEIARPELPWLIDFVQAYPPGGDEVGTTADGYDEFGRLADEDTLGPTEQRIKDLEEKIDKLEERRQQLEERRREREERPGARPPRRDREDEIDRGPDRERRDPIERQIEQLREQIEKLQPRADVEREERQKQADLRRAQEEIRRAQEEARRQRQGIDYGSEFDLSFGVEDIRVEEGATVRVWAADPTMQPGKTYRYKLLVAAINPLYAVPRLESKQLAENKTRAAIFPTDEEIKQMDWIDGEDGEGIKVEPRARFFFTSSGGNRAKVDIYRRYNGVMLKKNFDVMPGDPIGGVVTIKDKTDVRPDMDVDMGVGAVLVDIEARRDISGNPTYTMIYMDQEGNLHERSGASNADKALQRQIDLEIKDGPEHKLRPKEEDGRYQEDFGSDDFRDF